MSTSPLPDPERAAIVRLLSELHSAANADVGGQRVWLLLGVLGATCALAADDLEHHTGAERLHQHADWLAERVAELEGP